MKKIIYIMVLLMGLGYLSGLHPSAYAGKKPQYLIKFATVAPDGSAWVKQIRLVDKELREKSGGRMGLGIYAGGIAGDELDVLKKMRVGQLQCAAFSGVGFGKILPMVRVLDLPYLFRNDQEVDRVHRALFDYFAEAFQKKGFLPLVHSTGAILISSRYFKKLPPDLATLLQNTMKTAMADLTTTLRHQREDAIQVIRDSGITVIPAPSEAARKPFYDTHTKVARKLTGKIYPEALLLRVYEILKRPGS
ncbi:MAG: hypothetical protein B6240_15265 [Desulfobacteraceae bacterium 4572_87]|nr:MAG: hypothetical protein B6240_15265 [Desulfobacteraceae bacterium 4572_87]